MALNKIQAGFKVYEVGSPIDSRFIVANIAALSNLNVYDGLIVYVKDLKKFVFYSSEAIADRDTVAARWYILDKDTHIAVDQLFKNATYNGADHSLTFTKQNNETIKVSLADLFEKSAFDAAITAAKTEALRKAEEAKNAADVAGTKAEQAKSDAKAADQKAQNAMDALKAAGIQAAPTTQDQAFAGFNYTSSLAGMMEYANGRYTATLTGSGKPYFAYAKKFGIPKSIGFAGSINEAGLYEMVEKNQGGVDYLVFKSTVEMTLAGDKFEIKF